MNIDPDILSQLLAQQKQLGLPSAVATRSVLNLISQERGRSCRLEVGDLKSFVQAVLLHFKDLSLLELARSLRPYSKSVSELAEALCSPGPDMPDPVELVGVLLDAEVYLQTSESDMREALNVCGYTKNDIDQALHLNFPKTFDVEANRPWQDTGIWVGVNEKAIIQYVGGWWFISPELPRCDGNGGSRRINYPDYALPGYPEGGLAGRIDKQAFWVGNQGETPSGLAGQLQLCPNDDLLGSYSFGLADNIGRLTVKITVIRR
ncbi:hypothetical protein RBV54_000512 [Salmonella enterica]|nr:hypothetical protein [Salmonella enterica]ELF7042459.1 hypothetical protein [Salmonella enterica]